jgi:hypothetical protein
MNLSPTAARASAQDVVRDRRREQQRVAGDVPAARCRRPRRGRRLGPIISARESLGGRT